MSDEVELAAGSIEAALSVAVREAGILAPVKGFMEYLAKRGHYRRQATLAREATLAAEKIRALDLPVTSVEDSVVLRILEDGSWADNDDMQVAWANLLVNALTKDTPEVHAAFRVVLGELEPVEARTLDRLAELADFSVSPEEQQFKPVQLEGEGATGPHLDNLVRVGLLRYTRIMPTTIGSISDTGASVSGATFTDFGWAFVKACREPPQDN